MESLPRLQLCKGCLSSAPQLSVAHRHRWHLWAQPLARKVRFTCRRGGLPRACDASLHSCTLKGEGLDWKERTETPVAGNPIYAASDASLHSCTLKCEELKWKEGMETRVAGNLMYAASDASLHSCTPKCEDLQWKEGTETLVASNPMYAASDAGLHGCALKCEDLQWKEGTETLVADDPIYVASDASLHNCTLKCEESKWKEGTETLVAGNPMYVASDESLHGCTLKCEELKWKEGTETLVAVNPIYAASDTSLRNCTLKCEQLKWKEGTETPVAGNPICEACDVSIHDCAPKCKDLEWKQGMEILASGNPMYEASDASLHSSSLKCKDLAWKEGTEIHIARNPMYESVELLHASDAEVGEELHAWREECGVVGVYGDPEASRLCYLALHALQHRGQEGAGIVTSHNGSLHAVTGLGLVADVFDNVQLSKLPGTSAIGHVRYSTAGASLLKNVQPFVASYRSGSLGVAHNGNLVNYRRLRHQLEDSGSIFNTSSDTEVVLHLIATSRTKSFMARIIYACEQLEGAFSLVFLSEDKLVAVRDPFGFRPLVMGRRKNGAVVFASETCALDLIEAEYEREVNPGEAVVVEEGGVSSLCLLPHRQRQACIFEHIYFSLPNSIVFGRSVYQSRYKFGEILAEEAPVDCDVVIAVPDSGVVAALGYAAKAGVPFQQGLIRSHYVGRTFIEPSQKIRDFGVKLKLAPVHAVLKGKRVVVVDDSIVRGTTSSKIIRLIRSAGAAEVHMRVASPPIIGSCYYGVDTPSTEELISHRLSIVETQTFIGADSLAFLPLDRLKQMLGSEAPDFCDACFSGAYAVPPWDSLSYDADELADTVVVESLKRRQLDNSDTFKANEYPVFG